MSSDKLNKEYVLIHTSEEGFSAEFGLNIRTEWHEEEKLHYAFCDRFKLSDYAETEEKSLEGIIEVIQSFIEAIIEDGNLDSVLIECGFGIVEPTPYHRIFNIETTGSGRYIRSSFNVEGKIATTKT